jgi:hypothetical protein
MGHVVYICMYINAVANSGMLHLHDFYNIIFQIKHTLHTASGSAPPSEKFWVHKPRAVMVVASSPLTHTLFTNLLSY